VPIITAVILATKETEIRKLEVWSQPGQIVQETLSQKKKTITKKGWWSGSRCRPWVQAPVQQNKQMNTTKLAWLQKEKALIRSHKGTQRLELLSFISILTCRLENGTFFLFSFFAMLRMELRTWSMPGKCLPLSYTPSLKMITSQGYSYRKAPRAGHHVACL
jgi:hypothetical protein